MSNMEHLIENGLTAANEAHKNGKDAREAFYHEMSFHYNGNMLMSTQMKKEELWEIVQYVLFTWEKNENE